LIELLVVISIIALLASIAVPTANMVMKKAKEAQARAMMTGLVIGIKAYQTEYNRLPDPQVNSGGSPSTTDNDDMPQDGTPQNDLSLILHPDQTQPGPPANPRRINFYDPPTAKNGANGMTSDNKLVDPWSTNNTPHVFHVALDYDGDGMVKDPTDDPTSKDGKLAQPVAVWSTGYPTSPPNENTDTKKFLCQWK
jgi:type II secretory pathway pseudopilin PulG